MPQSDEFPPEWVEAITGAMCCPRGKCCFHDDPNKCERKSHEQDARAALRTLRRLLDEDGWQVVPRKPSEAQWEDIAANAVAHPEGNYMLRARQMWPELLAAAPSPWSAGDE